MLIFVIPKTQNMDSFWIYLVFACSLSCKLIVNGSQCCRNGWMSFENSCYWFADETNITWTEASYLCDAHDHAHIVTIESLSEDLFLRNQCQRLFKKGTSRQNWFWVGATDAEVEGVWVWYTNNNPLKGGYTNWAPGQPDSTHSRMNQDCAVLWGPSGYTWGDYICGRKSHVICEKNFTMEYEPDIIG